MDVDRWRRIEQLFHQAAALPADARDAYLRETCGGDDELRDQIRELLREPEATWVAVSPGDRGRFAPGTRFGAYQITGSLGAGGMGEVWRARDTKLGRDVAIKILPAGFASDPERLARFDREARTLASLNHPNIAAIFGIEDAGGTPALVLELVEGTTLQQRLAASHGGLPYREALDYARQVVSALDAAHEKGIVHRDLKPANIQVTPAGVVKVLDFGLAKTQTAGEVVVSNSPTITVGATRDGLLLGTAAYMSPEQARGRGVDKRTDVWAFGCVLFEMITGAPAFARETVSDTLAAILEREPDWSRLPARLPPAITKVLRRCLEKDPSRRLRDIGDAGTEIDEALAAARAPDRRRRPVGAVTIAMGGVVVAAAVFAIAWVGRGRTNTPGVAAKLTFTQLTSAPGAEWFPSLTPDGKWVVYSGDSTGNRDIYLQSVTGQNAINLTADSAADDDQPAVSPDGERIAFRSERDGGGIFVMGRTGEAVRRLTREGYRPAWSPDGRQLAYVLENIDVNPQNGRSAGGLRILDVSSGTARPIDRATNAVQACWSPRGDRLAVVVRFPDQRQAEIATVPVYSASDSDFETIVTGPATDWNPVWSPDGGHVYFTSDRGGTTNLWRVAVDARSGKPLAEPEPVTTPSSYAAHPAMAADGRHVAFSSVSITTNVARLTFDPIAGRFADTPVDVTSGTRAWGNPDPSPDGQWITFYSRLNPEGDVYVVKTDGTGLRQLTADPAIDRVPRWSPDGQWILFFSNRSGPYRLWGVHPDGSQLQQFTDMDSTYAVWSPDGSRIATSATTSTPAAGARKAFIFDPRTPWAAQVPDILPAIGDGSQPFVPTSWSPDGSRLVGQTSFSASGIATYSIANRRFEQLTNRGEWPVWLSDSRRILYSDGTGKYYYLLDSVTKEQRIVYTADREVLGGPRLTRDGRMAYFSRRVTQADIWMMTMN